MAHSDPTQDTAQNDHTQDNNKSTNGEIVVVNSEHYTLHVSERATDLAHPWSLLFLPGYNTPKGNEYMLVTERNGDIILIEDDRFIRLSFSEEIEVYQRNQGGWLDLAASPHFGVSNTTIFVSFSEVGSTARRNSTTVASFELPMSQINSARSTLRMDIDRFARIFTASPEFPSSNHFGSRLSIIHTEEGDKNEGILAVTVGERGKPENAQEDNFLGKTITLPYKVAESEGTISYLFEEPEILSLGHRNPQGLTYDAQSGFLILNDHGPRGGDELNAVLWPAHATSAPVPLNYGWPIISYGINYNGTRVGIGTQAEGYEEPSYFWDPSIAPSGLLVYTKNDGIYNFDEWNDNVFLCSLKFGLLVRLKVTFNPNASSPSKALIVEHEEQLFAGKFGRLRDVRQASDGSLYLLTDSKEGRILQVTPASPQ